MNLDIIRAKDEIYAALDRLPAVVQALLINDISRVINDYAKEVAEAEMRQLEIT